MTDIPPHIMQPLTRLWRLTEPIQISILPRDGWVLMACLQFAYRNPALNDTQRSVIEQHGRALQDTLIELEPTLAETMEQGWYPEFDRP